jgi:transposase InsO family protein
VIEEFPVYEYRRVTATLKRRGFNLNHKRILRVMRENNLTKKREKKYIFTTTSRHDFPLYPNLTKGLIPKDLMKSG